MAISPTLTKFPFLTVAALCRRAKITPAGDLELAGFVSRVIRAPGARAAELTLAVRVAGGPVRGQFKLEVSHTTPDGETATMAPIPFDLHPDTGAWGQLVMGIRLEAPGFHWLNVAISGILLTRVPVEVVEGALGTRKRAPAN